MLYFAPMKAYKYKLKPSARIVAVFEMWLQLLCELYNAALQERRDAWRMNHVSIGKKEQSAQLPAGVYFWKVLTPWAKAQGHWIKQ